MPWPPEMHRVARPRLDPWRWSWWTTVPTMRAPVMPIGWPRAMAPPLTLVRSAVELELAVAGQDLGRERLVDLDHVDLGRASSPARPAASAVAGTGPEPMTCGSTPALARADDPGQRADAPGPARASAAITTRAAAPSLIPEELPAVTVPGVAEDRLEPGQALQGGVGPRVLVALDRDRAPPGVEGRRPGRPRRRSARASQAAAARALGLAARRRPAPLGSIGVALGQVLGRLAHGLAGQGVEEAVGGHGVLDHRRGPSGSRRACPRSRYGVRLMFSMPPTRATSSVARG